MFWHRSQTAVLVMHIHSNSCGGCVQLCKAQEVKIRLTSRNWQQELCQRFLPEAPKPNGFSVACGATCQGLNDCKPQKNAPAAAGQDEQRCQEYCQLAPCVRLKLLQQLCYAVLNTYIFRQESKLLALILPWCSFFAVSSMWV